MKEEYNYFISLGEGCNPAMMLREINYRVEASPFDWLINVTTPKLLEIFKNDFHDMIPSKNEVEQTLNNMKNDKMVANMVTKYGLEKSIAGDIELFSGIYEKMRNDEDLNTENLELADMLYRVKYRYNKHSVKKAVFFPNKYGIIYVHELVHSNLSLKNNYNNAKNASNDVNNSSDDVDFVITDAAYKTFFKKYSRRINRLKGILENNNSTKNKVLFIHFSYTSLLSSSDTGENNWNALVELSELIKNKYVNLDFKILAFNVCRENRETDNIKHIYIKWNFLKDQVKVSRAFMKKYMQNNYRITK